MVGKTSPITKIDRVRFARLKSMACLACVQEGVTQPSRTEAHHLLSGGRRRGHGCTLPLCGWHHRGEHEGNSTTVAMRHLYGPSLALESKQFHQQYGSDDKLLANTNSILQGST